MTGKLLKYEFRSMIKQFAIIWPTALLLALINGLAQTAKGEASLIGGIWGSNIMMLIFVSVLIAMGVISLIFIIGRFNSGLLKDEGYLMFTLPVTPVQLIAAKLISATLVMLISGIVSLLSIFLLVSGTLEWHFILAQVQKAIAEISAQFPLWWVLAIESIVLAILFTANAVLQIYISISIGHLAKKHRTALAIVSFVLISSLTSTITDVVVDILQKSGIDEFAHRLLQNGEYFAFCQYAMLFVLGLVILFSALYFIASSLILSKKLNLE